MRKELILCGAAALTDLAVKAAVRKWKPEKAVYNHGFAANRLDSRPDIVACVSAGMTAFLAGVWAEAVTHEESPALKRIGLSLALGGAISNTAERIASRRVTDYLPAGKYVYNLGDFAIYAGALLHLAGELLPRRSLSSDSSRTS